MPQCKHAINKAVLNLAHNHNIQARTEDSVLTQILLRAAQISLRHPLGLEERL